MAVKKSPPRATRTKKVAKNRKVVKLKRKSNPLFKEIVSIVLVAVGILLMLALYVPGSGGILGAFVRSLFIGFFGFSSFLLPIFCAGVGAYTFLSKDPPGKAKLIMIALIFLSVSSFAFLLSGGITPETNSFFGYVGHYYQTAGPTNGGLLGGIFGNTLVLILGEVGAYVVLFTALLILGILLTGKSVTRFLQSMATGVRDFRDASAWDDEDDDYDDEEDETPAHSRSRVLKPKGPSNHVFTIEESSGKSRGEQVALVGEYKRKEEKPPVALKERKTENVMDAITLDGPSGKRPQPVLEEEEPAYPETVEEDIRMFGFEEMPALDAEEYFPPQEVFVETRRTPEPEEPAFAIKEYVVEKPQDMHPVQTMQATFSQGVGGYVAPPLDFLNQNPASSTTGSRAQILENSRKLEETLRSFGVEAKVVEVSKGPTVTRYELSPGVGVKVSKISGLADDLALNLAAAGIRIEAPIPGKAAVGIEVPNKEVTPVFLREVLGDEAFTEFPSKLAFGMGKDIAGNTVVADIAKMPHLLIAGATGSGKSVCVNTLITSIIYKANPDEVKLLMVDPKVVELSVYNGIPHLLIPVVTDPKKAAGALNWAVQEMITRYGLFAETGVRDLKGYNASLKEQGEAGFLPQIVIIIDELADLMMAAPGEVEDAICRLAQMARAAGLHLIIATQRPSVDVITGLIKANIPSRLAFSVSSGTDSRTILDMTGAEKLLGKGDMLFFPVGMGKPLRVQGAFISDKEVENIVAFVKTGNEKEYDQEMIDKITAPKAIAEAGEDADEFFEPAVEFLIQKEKASTSLLQRQFRIGYNRASRLMEELEMRGIVGPEDGSKPRKVLMTATQWAEWKARKQGE